MLLIFHYSFYERLLLSFHSFQIISFLCPNRLYFIKKFLFIHLDKLFASVLIFPPIFCRRLWNHQLQLPKGTSDVHYFCCQFFNNSQRIFIIVTSECFCGLPTPPSVLKNFIAWDLSSLFPLSHPIEITQTNGTYFVYELPSSRMHCLC